MKVFLSHSIAPDDGPVAARLRAVAAAYEIQIMLPDRSSAVSGVLPASVRRQIDSAQAVVLLATEGAVVDPHVPDEIEYAIANGVPLLALVEDGVEIDFLPRKDLVSFDRHERAAHEKELIVALKQLARELKKKESKETAQAVGWIAGIAIGLIGLGALAAALANEGGDEAEDV